MPISYNFIVSTLSLLVHCWVPTSPDRYNLQIPSWLRQLPYHLALKIITVLHKNTDNPTKITVWTASTYSKRLHASIENITWLHGRKYGLYFQCSTREIKSGQQVRNLFIFLILLLLLSVYVTTSLIGQTYFLRGFWLACENNIFTCTYI